MMYQFASAILFLAAAASAFDAPRLRGTYSMMGHADVNSFFDIPRTAEDAINNGWVQPPETLNNTKLRTFCYKEDARICTLVDLQGSIAGYQISFTAAVKELNISEIDYPSKGFKELTLFGQPMFSNQIFFVPQEVIENGGRKFDNQTGTGLWLQAGQELTNTPIHEDGMWNTSFTRQKCFPRMGQHYFWKVSPELKKVDFMPWFTLFDTITKDLIGFGFISFGSNKDQPLGDRRPWMEAVPVPAIYAIAPEIPDWIAEYVNTYGVFSHHVYFIEKPWEIKC